MQFVRGQANNFNIGTFLRRLVNNEAFLLAFHNSENDKDNPNYESTRVILDRLTVGPVRETSAGVLAPNYTENALDSDNMQVGDLAKIARRGTGLDVQLFETAISGEYDWFTVTTAAEHNDGPETIFAGTTWAFSAETHTDVVLGIAANHPGFHQHWSRMILQEFLTPNPPLALVNNFAEVIKATNNDMEEAMRILFASKAFHHPNYINTLPKNPLELMVEFIRTMNMLGAANQFEIGDDHIATIESSYLRSAIGWNITDNVSVTRQSWGDATTTLEMLRRKGEMTQLAYSTEGLMPPLWLRTDSLPTGERSSGYMINNSFSRFGVDMSDDQRTFFEFFMDFVVNSGFREYDNLDPDHQSRKGIRLQLMSSTLPGARLK
jgi:hypothetical protein